MREDVCNDSTVYKYYKYSEMIELMFALEREYPNYIKTYDALDMYPHI